MKRGGTLAFIIYLVGFIASAITAVYFYMGAPAENDFGSALGHVLMFIISLMVAIPYGIVLVVKIFHMISGWKFFSVLCIICDILIIVYFAIAFASKVDITSAIASIAILFVPPSVALISEIKGLSA